MSEEINAIIDKLCEKLGTSAELLIPELAKLRITESIVTIIISILLLAVGIFFLPRAWKYDHRDKEYFEDSYFILIPAFIISVGTFALVVWVIELAGWLASPTAKAVLEIVGMIK